MLTAAQWLVLTALGFRCCTIGRLVRLRAWLRLIPDPEQATADREYQRLVFARRLYASRRISEGVWPSSQRAA